MNHTKDYRKYERILKIVDGIAVGAGCFFLLCIFLEALHPAILGDETFSMKLAEKSYADIVRYTAQDVHPPLYYWILKTVLSIGNLFSINPVISGKLASVIPWILLTAVAWFRIRREFPGTFGIFFLCLTGMPQMMRYAVEIRMYGWGMCFLVLAYLALCKIIRGAEEWRQYVWFGLFGLLAAYTHYFSCVAAAFLYLSLSLYLFLYRRKSLKKWLLSAAIAVIGYLPWLPVIRRQMGAVKADYWIEKISLSTLFSFFQFLFNPKVYRWHSGTILGFLTFLLLAGTIVLLWRCSGEAGRETAFCATTGVGVPFFIIAVGVAASICMKPVLVQRYLFFGLGTLWLGFAIAISKRKNPLLKTGVLVFLLCVTTMNLTHFMRVERESREGWQQIEALLGTIREGDVILANLGQTRLALSYAMPETQVCYYWRQQTEELFKEMFGNLTDTRDEAMILSYLTDENRIYFFDTLDNDEFHFKEDCSDQNVFFTDAGIHCIEDVRVQLYIIEKGE